MRLPCILLPLLFVAWSGRAAEPLAGVIDSALATSTKQYEWMLAHLPADGKHPRTLTEGKLTTVLARDWTSGFFPGSL